MGIDALRPYAYRRDHVPAFRRRKEGFEASEEAFTFKAPFPEAV